jgi:uncharacterized membrane protein YccF (DUF307 family)
MGLLNCVWFVVFGWWQALAYLLVALIFAITIVGIPLAKSLLQFAKLNAFPFGKEIVKETELKSSDSISGIRKICGTIVNIIWFPIGVILAIAYIVSGIISFITVVGIPAGIVYVRSAKFVIWPIGAKCVSKKQAYAAAVANEIEKRQQ